jgi:hypothetical protein
MAPEGRSSPLLGNGSLARVPAATGTLANVRELPRIEITKTHTISFMSAVSSLLAHW